MTDQPVVLVVSGDTAGWLVPEGCTAHQSGGLPRRGSFVAKLRREAAVIVGDVGGAAGGTAPYDQVRLEAILRGELLMNLAAHNIGAAEAAFGPAYLRLLVEERQVPLVSANTVDVSGKLIVEPVRLAAAAGRSFAIVGVLGERYATPEIRTLPPRQAIRDALQTVAGRYEAVIVLAYMPAEELQRLAESLPEAHVVLGGPTGQPLAPRLLGTTLLAAATDKGKSILVLRAPPANSTEAWSGRLVELDKQFSDDQAQLGNLREFYLRVAAYDFPPQQTSFIRGFPLRPADWIAGSKECQNCHAEEYRCWEQSSHAKTWKSLAEREAWVDPYCQHCHTTGYGLPGGFTSVEKTPERLGVGCEGCHGPSGAHVRDPKITTANGKAARNLCLLCHDAEHSPRFDYAAYWAKVRHGKAQPPDPHPDIRSAQTPP